jgi:hydroxymethylglutaryl-CoA reductase (NADPH)
MVWMLNHTDALKQIAESTTRHGKLVDMRFTVNGNHVYVQFEYTTGNAAGQNMVTIATQAIFNHIMENSPIRPSYGFVETNMSGDKKASAQAFMSVRGKKVTTEVVIPAELLRKRLHVSPQQMLDYWKMACMGSMMSGSFGVQGHYANGLAALYLATGQDVACVAESAIGLTRFDVKADGSFYATVTLPSLTVGTVGGGTGLPSQQACLGLMGINPADEHSALVYAEVCTALALAGELSIVAALSSNEFTRAHQHLAREKNRHDEG